LSVQAGLRVSVKGHYLPLVGPVTDKMWVFTGLGSRGLLYHALFASILVEAISSSSEDPIPAAVRLSLSKNRSSLYNKLKV
jgi:glycine/D-amino acid oxidase-like deaminating enzyme